MDNFIKMVEIIESENPGLKPLAVLRGLRKAAGIDTPFIQHYLGPLTDAQSLVLKATITDYISRVLKHRLVQNLEEGVVLTADGTTVALTPLLLGLEAGLKSTSWPNVPGLHPLSLTKNLALFFLQHSNADSSTVSRLGTGGCWDNVRHPQVFTLSDVASLATDASLISQFRRNTFKKLVSLPSLKKQLAKSLSVYRRLAWHSHSAAPAFILPVYPSHVSAISAMSDLPAVLSGHEGYATLPPGCPRLNFKQQSDCLKFSFFFLSTLFLRSFVVGSYGYIYEGRGWFWQGAHTKGYNSKGYGVSFIGDYMSSIPSNHTMDVVRNQFAKCATEGGKLVPNFTIHGHRQLVNTSCPGDAFYSEIKKWEHFKEVKP